MPYKYDDKWHRHQRQFISKKVRSGRLYPRSEEHYRSWLHAAWEIMGEPDPEKVTLEMMENLEQAWRIGENTKASRLRVVKEFLRWVGCKAAMEWDIRAQARPKADRLFFPEDAVADMRQIARSMGAEYELIFSLGVDNSLREGDQSRITAEEAKMLLWHGQAVITCKGRNGGKRRLLVMHNITRAPLNAYLKVRAEMVQQAGYDPGGLLLTHYHGKLVNMSSRTVGDRIISISDKVGVKFRSHDLRATFGNRHWKKGTDMATIAKLMGHESPDQTFKAYIGVSQEDQRNAQNSLGPQE